jgi:riboflavin kinase, archaea type
MSSRDITPGATPASDHSALSTQHSALTIEGVLRDGLQVAAQFTELPWVREQFQRKLGLDIWPGTVNLQVQDPAGLTALARLRAGPDAPDPVPGAIPIEPPSASPSTGEATGPAYCVGYCYHARLGPIPAAIVVPHVPDYPPDKLELVAPVRVRDALGLNPGDRVTVTVGALSPASLAHQGKGESTNPLTNSPPLVGERQGEGSRL